MTDPRPVRTAAVPRRDGDHVLTRGGARLFVRDWGAGRPVLLLPGWGSDTQIWAPVMLRLVEAGLRAVSCDRRGHGRSSDAGPWDYDTLADDLVDVMAALELQDVVVVAHSGAGGEVVRALERHGPARMARLVLVGCTLPAMARSPSTPDGVPVEAIEAALGQLRDDLPAWLDANAEPFVPGASARTVAWLSGMVTNCSRQALVEFQREIAYADFRRALARVELPVTIVQGDLDVSAPPALCGLRQRALIPHAELLDYAGTAHGVMVTHPQRLADDLVARARR